MKLTLPFLSLALFFAVLDSAHSRVLPVESAPYARNSGGIPALVPRSPPSAPDSVLHRRVTRHIRPEYPSVSRRQTVDNGGINTTTNPQPIRGSKGAPFLHDSNTPIDRQNPDSISPPPTDAGNVPNLKWSFSLSHSRLLNGGWVREQTVTDLPSSPGVAAAEQRLSPYAYRELHWHRVAEWGLVLNGTVRITANDEEDRNYVGDAGVGDLWSFPAGIPHTLQAGPEGAEYLLVFDDGNFDAAGTTFMLDDWIAHTPREVLAENFGWNASVFGSIPSPDPYLVPAGQNESWLSLEEARQAVSTNPGGEATPYVYALSQQNRTQAPGGGGWVKVTDYRQFPSSPTLASAYVHVEKGGLRELHWHKNAEWGYIVKGKARATAFAGGATARTFDLQAGDSWVFPTNYGHYLQNVGEEPLEFIEIFRGANFGDRVRFDDFSLTQWLALLPPSVAAKQLNVTEALVRQLKRAKQVIVAG
ncbi:Cupin 1 [Kalmanozyma brasiliensis GHG001]|uniref:Cupin type-1 domain-containing protein n=1 Tax=Kalmanozyma brasiliensis (strain GHG001) TaxID=1365824 RepID=V5F086_KALBG|nr:Cupin 1 [Kalmanozyma brasiliensis GHG001]EST08594.1 Cupin 1 [Kalmanozyma brasiliensis GHG001]